MEDKIFCPLIDKDIIVADCVENTAVVDKLLKEDSLPKKFKQKENWREICKNCKYYDY